MRISISCGPFTEKNTVEIEKQQSHPRRAQQSHSRRQSAAVLPSYAPHDSKARLQHESTRGEATYTAPDSAGRAALQVPICQCAGSRGKTPRPFSRGFKGDTLFREREYPPLSVQRQALLSPRHQCRSFLCTCAKKRKKETKSPRRERRGLLAVLCVYF